MKADASALLWKHFLVCIYFFVLLTMAQGAWSCEGCSVSGCTGEEPHSCSISGDKCPDESLCPYVQCYCGTPENLTNSGPAVCVNNCTNPAGL